MICKDSGQIPLINQSLVRRIHTRLRSRYLRQAASRYVILATLAFSCADEKKSESLLFEKGISLGTVDERLIEASGLVESIANPKHFWTLNDSGNPAEVFLIDQQAKTKLVCHLAGVKNRDFEDIAIGLGPDSTKRYVYVADIGDNFSIYKTKRIYRFEEPTLTSAAEIIINKFDVLQISLPDGARDSETLIIEPRTNNLYLISKSEDSVRVYRENFPFDLELRPKFMATIPFHKIVSASISPDGTEVLLKDYDNVYYWSNPARLPLEKLLKQKPSILAYDREKLGEAIAWARDASGYYTLSEKRDGVLGKLLFYKRR